MHGKKKIGVEHVPRVEPSWRVSSIVCRPGTGERVCGACIRVDERGVVGGRDMARLWALSPRREVVGVEAELEDGWRY